MQHTTTSLYARIRAAISIRTCPNVTRTGSHRLASVTLSTDYPAPRNEAHYCTHCAYDAHSAPLPTPSLFDHALARLLRAAQHYYNLPCFFMRADIPTPLRIIYTPARLAHLSRARVIGIQAGCYTFA